MWRKDEFALSSGETSPDISDIITISFPAFGIRLSGTYTTDPPLVLKPLALHQKHTPAFSFYVSLYILLILFFLENPD